MENKSKIILKLKNDFGILKTEPSLGKDLNENSLHAANKRLINHNNEQQLERGKDSIIIKNEKVT